VSSTEKRTDDEKTEARRREIADRKAALAWLGTLGVLGWMIAVPILAGIFLGRALDHRLGTGYAFTIGLLVAGIVLGCGGAWRWVKKRIEDEKKT